VVDRPITSGHRNDAMRIDTGGVSICRGRFSRVWHCWNRSLNRRPPAAGFGSSCRQAASWH